MTPESQIEAILFWKGEPVKIKELASILDIEVDFILQAISRLEVTLIGRGLQVVRNGDEIMLYTAKEASELIKKLTKDELSEDISKASVEVLSLIIYRGPIAKRDIDYIRGVNSSYIVRNLLVRGLVERIDYKDNGSFVYQPTFELLSHLGVTKKEDLPDFELVQKDIEKFMQNPEVTDSKNE